LREIKGCLFLLIAILWVGGLYGARPFSTDDAGTVEQSIYELELGLDFWSGEARPGLGFKHGLTDRMDLGVGLGYTMAPEEEAGFENAELGLKFVMIPHLFAVSITGSFGLEAYMLNGIVTRTFGPLEVDGNFGYETAGTASDVGGTITYALALIFDAGQYAIGIEGVGEKDGLQTWLVGGRYNLFDGFAADVGIYGGFGEDSEMAATIGIHYEF
jgi:hypothetical protein